MFLPQDMKNTYMHCTGFNLLVNNYSTKIIWIIILCLSLPYKIGHNRAPKPQITASHINCQLHHWPFTIMKWWNNYCTWNMSNLTWVDTSLETEFDEGGYKEKILSLNTNLISKEGNLTENGKIKSYLCSNICFPYF